jgi:hypothetical protein
MKNCKKKMNQNYFSLQFFLTNKIANWTTQIIIYVVYEVIHIIYVVYIVIHYVIHAIYIVIHVICIVYIPYILTYKSIFRVGKRECPEAPQLICVSYFLPAEGNMFSAILDTQHYRVQPNMSQSWNKIVTLLAINPLLFNK